MTYAATAEVFPTNQGLALADLIEEMKNATVEALTMLGGNPAYTAPTELDFGKYLGQIKRSIHLGLDLNETALTSTWHIPQSHYLESWGDARAFDGTVSLMQPLIAPLYDGKSAHELLAEFVVVDD